MFSNTLGFTSKGPKGSMWEMKARKTVIIEETLGILTPSAIIKIVDSSHNRREAEADS